ncbi:MAG TPA: hypothetical protein VMV92_41775 [Streptosporangiaceae bacterium]|nr:hypothetical protein [Streptosporangiaceae bacterium]
MTSTAIGRPAPSAQGPDPLALMRRLTSRDLFILRVLADHQVLATDRVAQVALTTLLRPTSGSATGSSSRSSTWLSSARC